MAELIAMARWFPLLESPTCLRTILSAGVPVLLVLAWAGTAA